MIEILILLATGLSTGEAAHPPAEALLPAILDRRLDEASTRQVLVELEGLRPTGATRHLPLESAILQTRLWVAEQYGDDDPQLYLDGVKAGLALLGPARGPAPSTVEELVEKLGRLEAPSAAILLWTALAHAHTVETRPWYARAGAARNLVAMVERAVALDGDVFHGGPHRVLANYRLRAPDFMQGDDDTALADAKLAVERAPNFAPNLLTLARVAEATGAPPDEVQRLLRRILALDPDQPPGAVPEQRRAIDQARALLGVTP